MPYRCHSAVRQPKTTARSRRGKAGNGRRATQTARGAGGARTRDQRINAPPFAVVANRSRNYLRGKRLRCLLITHGCHKFSLSHGHKRLIKDELIRNDKGVTASSGYCEAPHHL